MLDHLLTAFPDCSGGEWTPGQAFADPQAVSHSDDVLIAELGGRPLDLVLRGLRSHRLELRAAMAEPRIVTRDVIAASARDGEVVLTWSAPHTLVGTIGAIGSATLSDLDGTPCTRRGPLTLCEDGSGVLALAVCGPLFALARGVDADAARSRALAGVTSMPWQQAESRLALSCGASMAERREV